MLPSFACCHSQDPTLINLPGLLSGLSTKAWTPATLGEFLFCFRSLLFPGIMASKSLQIPVSSPAMETKQCWRRSLRAEGFWCELTLTPHLHFPNATHSPSSISPAPCKKPSGKARRQAALLFWNCGGTSTQLCGLVFYLLVHMPSFIFLECEGRIW